MWLRLREMARLPGVDSWLDARSTRARRAMCTSVDRAGGPPDETHPVCTARILGGGPKPAAGELNCAANGVAGR
eukprot:9127482-Pyramimonas_sp.AAC.1